MYRCGKLRFTNEELYFIEFVEQIKSRKTTKKYIKFFKDRNWIKYNHKTNYYILNSFDNIRIENDWTIRLAFKIYFGNYYKIEAVIGAVIYGYLHRDFWRKVKRNKSVHIKERTYHFICLKFNFKKQPAPISVLGVCQILNISKSTASRLKKEAQKTKYINVQKDYLEENINQGEIEFATKNYKEEIIHTNLVFHEGKHKLRLIDLIYPNFHFTKRKSLGT